MTMRGSDPGELLKIVVALLEHQVLPVVETTSGRTTLLLSVGMLDNLAERVEERQELVDRERALAEELMSTVPEGVRALAAPHRDGPSERPTPTTELIAVFRAIVSNPSMLEDPETDEWLGTCQRALRERTRLEVALLNPTRYLRSQNA